MDRFRSFFELKQHAAAGKDFVIETRPGDSGYAIMAPHGGGIEPATDLAAAATAGTDHAYYAFKGIRPSQNTQLHIASHRFDEPLAMAMARVSHTIITLHGCRAPKPVIYVGGREEALKRTIMINLKRNGFPAGEAPKPSLGGVHHTNLCNRGIRGKGIQLELSGQIRRQLLGGGSWRKAPMTPELGLLSLTLRQALASHLCGMRPRP